MTETAFAARHSMDSPEWYTPSPFVEAAREVMGGIDLDPASHEEANRIVNASRYYTEAENGLMQEWRGRVFVNPPGGLVAQFWKKLLFSEYEEAVWIGYSLEQLQTLQCCDAPKSPIDFTICVPNKRISFIENEAKKAARLAKIRAENARRIARGDTKMMSEKNGPSHANYVTYIGPHKTRFDHVFSRFGHVVTR